MLSDLLLLVHFSQTQRSHTSATLVTLEGEPSPVYEMVTGHSIHLWTAVLFPSLQKVIKTHNYLPTKKYAFISESKNKAIDILNYFHLSSQQCWNNMAATTDNQICHGEGTTTYWCQGRWWWWRWRYVCYISGADPGLSEEKTTILNFVIRTFNHSSTKNAQLDYLNCFHLSIQQCQNNMAATTENWVWCREGTTAP